MNTDQEQEVMRIGKRLEKITQNDISNEDEVLGLLRTLQGCTMSLDVLQKARVGLSVNRIRQKYSGTEVASVAKKLIKSWKKLLPGGQNSSSSSKSKTKEDDDSPKSDEGAATGSLASSVRPATPPPVAYSSQSSNSPQGNGNGEGQHHQSDDKKKPERRLSSVSDDIILSFPPSVDSYARIAATGVEIRDRCRDLLVKALMKGFSNVSIEEEIQFYNLCAQIEEKIYSEFKDVGNKYKQRIRSRVSNLGDLKNPGLRQNVISGHVSPTKMANMTAQEMASDAMKKLRQKLTKEAIRDAQVATSTGTQTSLLKCGKCGKRNCTYTQAQTRSADEPMTTFAYCNDCGHRWKFC